MNRSFCHTQHLLQCFTGMFILKKTVVENNFLSQVPVFIHEQYVNQSQVNEAMQYNLPKCQKTYGNISMQPMRFE